MGSTRPSRLSVCYVAPGQHLLGTAGPTRNVLNLAAALARRADVTVAFRRVLDPDACTVVKALEIDSENVRRAVVDDAAVRGAGLAEFARYIQTVRRFARTELTKFDLVFEKSWTLSGLVAAECKRLHVPAVVVENLVPVLDRRPGRGGPLKRLKLWGGRVMAGRYLRGADRVIAETAVLKAAMVEQWHIPAQRICVVPLGVDRSLFRPAEQAAARSKLGLGSRPTILLYSGIVDETHNLRPVLEVLSSVAVPDTELHIIGDGPLRPELERNAAERSTPAFFHGRVAYEQVPEYIAAADLCLAPYEPAAFSGGQVAYSSLKIPEYLSVGRAVVSVPSGRVTELVEHGVTGFLFPNSVAEWSRFLLELPDRARLAAMGRAAREARFDSWDDVAEAYLKVGRSEIEKRS